MITSFASKQTCKNLQDECVKALEVVAAAYGLKVLPAGGTMGSVDFTAKFKFIVADTATVEAHAREQFNQYCAVFDLKPEQFGQEFRYGGHHYKIVGLHLNSRTFPLNCLNVNNGKHYKFNVAMVRNANPVFATK